MKASWGMARHAVDPAKRFAVENLEVFWVAVEFLKLLDPVMPHLWRTHSGLYDHLKRATASVLSNIGEAASTLRDAERRRFFEFAYRSAGECSSMVVSFNAIGAFTTKQNEAARALLHRIQMMLLRLIQKDTRAVAKSVAQPKSRTRSSAPRPDHPP